MKHPNIAILEKLYADFSRGDFASALEPCADQMTFQVPGKSKLAGKYTKATFPTAYALAARELSANTFELQVHDILAGDQHATVLGTCRLMRGDKAFEYRTVHVWRFEGGKPVAWYEYPRDLYQYDAVWS